MRDGNSRCRGATMSHRSARLERSYEGWKLVFLDDHIGSPKVPGLERSYEGWKLKTSKKSSFLNIPFRKIL
jgi:hypothetical protein